jgi:rhamnosyltransferase
VPGASVIIRVRDEERSLDRCLGLIAAQTGVPGPVEVIVVDLGSEDCTPDVADRHGARLVRIARQEFSFGGALNAGAERARHEVLVSLSAHAFPTDPGWLARLVAALQDPTAACACGDRYGPDGAPLGAPIAQDAALARRRPEWGYSNAAGGFRAELWRRRPFRADLPGCEDKEWSLHWLAQGYTCVVDPALAVDHDHTHDSLRAIFTRARREAAAYRAFLPPADAPGARAGGGGPSPRALAHEWWSDTRWYASPVRARLSHRRAARLLGAYAGRRSHT